jgi:hypothetical protein
MAPETETESAALRALAGALLPYLREFIALEQRDRELVDVAATLPLPRRLLFRACRSGAIAGAARIGRRWLATRGAVEAWARSKSPPVPGAYEDHLQEMRKRLARSYADAVLCLSA